MTRYTATAKNLAGLPPHELEAAIEKALQGAHEDGMIQSTKALVCLVRELVASHQEHVAAIRARGDV